MARVQVQQYEILDSVVSYLKTNLSLSASQCYMTLDPDAPRIPVGGNYWLSVSPNEGTFDESLFIGGSTEQCHEEAIFTVTGYSAIYLDSTNPDEYVLNKASRGLLRVKQIILKAMAGYDFTVTDTVGEETATNYFSRQLCCPVRASMPKIGQVQQDDGVLPIAWISVDFLIPFDWDLS